MRGAFGVIFRKLVCMPECEDAKSCSVRTTCPYACVFEPQASRGDGPSGLADSPRSFVFRASHLDGLTIHAGETFHFDVHIFDVGNPSIQYFVLAFAQLAREGLGPGRGRAKLVAVEQLDLDGQTLNRVFDGDRFQMSELSPPNSIDLRPSEGRATQAIVRFVTPTELKGESKLAEQPEFGVLFRRLRDRINTLRTLYGAGKLDIDFRAMGERASAVQMTKCQLMETEAERLSSRTGQRHSLGGFVGEVEYEGVLGEFLPYLRLGKWVGVGRQTVWGKGEIEVVEFS